MHLWFFSSLFAVGTGIDQGRRGDPEKQRMGYICSPKSFCLFSSILPQFHSLYGKAGYGFFCDELPIKVFTLLKLLVKCTDFMHVVCTLFQIMCKNTHSAC